MSHSKVALILLAPFSPYWGVFVVPIVVIVAGILRLFASVVANCFFFLIIVVV